MRLTPAPKTLRFAGRARPRVAPFGAVWVAEGEPADAFAVQLESDPPSAQEAATLVPDAASVPRGTWVLVLPEPARGKGLLSAFHRKPIARATRAGALLLRGYVEIGADVDAKSQMDLVYGKAY